MSKEVETLRYLILVVPLIKVGDEVVHKEWGDIMENAATTASSLEAEQDSESDEFKQIVDFLNAKLIKYALTVSPTIYTSCIKQFWTSAKVKTVHDAVRLQALVDGRRIGNNREHIHTPSHDPLPSGEDRLQLSKLIEICTKLSDMVLSLEQTKTTQAVGLSARVESSMEEEGLGTQEDASKQGRIADIDAAEDLFIIDESTQDQGRINDQDMFGVLVKDNKEKDKIKAKPDKIKSKREARKSPESSPTMSKPACEDFTTFSNILFDTDYDFYSSDDQSFSDEDVPKKIYSNPLFDEEIISMKIDPHYFNAESNLIESLLNHDSSIISSSSNIDSLFDEFAGEPTLLKSIPPGINEIDCDPEEETHFIKRLLYDNLSPRPSEEFVSKNSDAAIESFSPSPIPVEDSDSLMEEIDLSFTSDYPMPPGIEEDDYDSERDILILEELLSNNSFSLPKNESFHFDIPSFSHPHTKPPDGNTGILNVKVMGDISKHKVPMHRLMFTQPTLVPNQDKYPDLLPHQGHEAFQPSAECPMMIHEKNTPILDVLFFHFYPPLLIQVKDNKEKDKIRAKPNKIKSKREARKSPESSPTKSNPGQSQESIKVHDLEGDEVFIDVKTGENVEQGETFTKNVEGIAAAITPQITKDELTLAQTLLEIKAAKPKAKGVIIQEPSEFRTTSLVLISNKLGSLEIIELFILCFEQGNQGVTPLIDHHCCYKCRDSLNDFFYHQCTCEFYRNGAHDGYNYPSLVPFIQTLPSFPQQYPCCEDYGDTRETFQCQPMNYFESNTRYDSNYSGFDQIEPPQYSVNPSLNIQNVHDAHELFINSLRMGDERLDTIPKTESNKFIKSRVETLVRNPSKSEDLSDSEYDVPTCDDFTTFSNLLFDADYDFSSSDDESFSDEDISKKIYSNPLFDEEIISMKIDPHYFNVESDLIESLLNQDSSIISSSSKIDSLLDEFTGELILLKTIPPGINETDCDPEEEIRLIKKLLYYNSSPQIDLSFTSDDLMPPGIENDDYESELDMLILEELLSNDSLSLPENESFHFYIPSSSRPPAKPPDDDSSILTVKVVDDISKHDVPMPILLRTQPTLVSNQEKSPHLLSHRGFKASQLHSKSQMAILSGAENRPPMLEKDMYAPGGVEWKSEAIQAHYDVKATNIILQALPPEIYALVSMHKVAKDL
uniref:Uncharacterized protein n=1 Tax=Tanacetum cinerariifolium TaxID=118510 RepID=A0A6L2JZ82_TANCI|nr:hypothetical protein [Tanacetum cinerariifolium]